MLGICIPPLSIDMSAPQDGRSALRTLAFVARSYLHALEEAVTRGEIEARSALVTRVRGTGPGVSFGSLIAAVEAAIPLQWSCPFEGSNHVSGAPLAIGPVLGESRDDGFLFLRFDPHTVDLPLHIHPMSDRFIFVIAGRGFFHASPDVLESIDPTSLRHIAARDRDVLMFRRGVVHTFSSAAHPLFLLSYHRPFVPLDEPGQFTCSNPPSSPVDFLKGFRSQVSFDAAWTLMNRPS